MWKPCFLPTTKVRMSKNNVDVHKQETLLRYTVNFVLLKFPKQFIFYVKAVFFKFLIFVEKA